MPAGRPTSYDPKFCEMLIEHMAKGYSFESFGSVTDTCKDTLYEWVKVHPQFSDSKKRATEKSRYWWESQGIDNILNKKEMTKDSEGNTVLVETSLNAAAWIFNMKNRFKEEWRDKQEIETTPSTLTVTISGPIPPSE
jgi:hypothetical protein